MNSYSENKEKFKCSRCGKFMSAKQYAESWDSEPLDEDHYPVCSNCNAKKPADKVFKEKKTDEV